MVSFLKMLDYKEPMSGLLGGSHSTRAVKADPSIELQNTPQLKIIKTTIRQKQSEKVSRPLR